MYSQVILKKVVFPAASPQKNLFLFLFVWQSFQSDQHQISAQISSCFIGNIYFLRLKVSNYLVYTSTAREYPPYSGKIYIFPPSEQK